MKYYLRMEGVNLGSFVYDTADLSTIRGGSLLLQAAVEKVKKHFNLLAVSTGSSAGIFSIECNDNDAACKLRDIIQFLNKDPNFKYATFVVDIRPASADDEFTKDRESLMALNRWQQMQAPSIAIPSPETSKEVCEIDRIRLATKTSSSNKRVSQAVYIRREYGKQQKQRFYQETIGADRPKQFVNEFEELAGRRGKPLNDKMAVLYLDGNQFSKIQRNNCRNQTAQQEFDEHLKTLRKTLLHDHLDATCNHPDWLTPEGKYRMETLLWGGDDILWVVPAWVGWSFAACFYTRSQNWTFRQALKHGGGLVFCHHNAPIDRVKQLALNLADCAKKKGRQENYLAYQVLESFDHAGLDLDQFRKQRCPKGIESEAMILHGDRLATVLQHIALIKRGLPSRVLHKIVTRLFEQTDATDNTAFLTALWEQLSNTSTAKSEVPNDVLARRLLGNLPQDTREALCQVANCFGQDTLWLHLADLWDYLESNPHAPH